MSYNEEAESRKRALRTTHAIGTISMSIRSRHDTLTMPASGSIACAIFEGSVDILWGLSTRVSLSLSLIAIKEGLWWMRFWLSPRAGLELTIDLWHWIASSSFEWQYRRRFDSRDYSGMLLWWVQIQLTDDVTGNMSTWAIRGETNLETALGSLIRITNEVTTRMLGWRFQELENSYSKPRYAAVAKTILYINIAHWYHMLHAPRFLKKNELWNAPYQCPKSV